MLILQGIFAVQAHQSKRGIYTMTEATQRLAAKKIYGSGSEGGVSYMDQEVMSWSPEKITLKTFDLFIVSCKKQDVGKMNRILMELMGSLNFEYEDVSTRLYRLYEYCQSCILKRNYDVPLRIISEMRDSWARAHKLD